MLQKGKTTEDITKQLIEEYSAALDDPDEGPIFWFALADTQWQLGRLLPDVKQKALEWIDKGGDIEIWRDDNPKMVPAREKVLHELKERLNSPLPPEKKISQPRSYKCEWKIGDVFAYKLESDLAVEKGLAGRYLLIQKIDEYIWYPEHVIPIVYVKLTKDENLPSTIEEYNKIEYVQTSISKYNNLLI